METNQNLMLANMTNQDEATSPQSSFQVKTLRVASEHQEGPGDWFGGNNSWVQDLSAKLALWQSN